MPVGTAGTVKGIFPRDLREIGTEISLANTYHLHLQPGEKIVAAHGGIHAFMGVDWPVLTDSGGFQVFSLPKTEFSEEGVRFRFQKGGEEVFATPEWSMQVQEAIGADIIMAFDECVPWPCKQPAAKVGVERTLRWLDRCIAAHSREDQALFGIVQGSVFDDLRAFSARETIKRDLPGYAIGGVSVGEGHALMMQAVDAAEPELPAGKPRYLMGVGLPEDLVGAVGRGMDMFDCVIPTRYARSGTLFTSRGRIRVDHKRYRNDRFPIDASCECYACRNFTRSYVHHLVKSGELLGTTLCSLHNVAYYHRLMGEMREAISAGTFMDFCADFEREYLANDRERRREVLNPGWYRSFDPGYAKQFFDAESQAPDTSSRKPTRKKRRRR